MGSRFQPLFQEMGKHCIFWWFLLERRWFPYAIWTEVDGLIGAPGFQLIPMDHIFCSMKCWGIPGSLPVYPCIIMDYHHVSLHFHMTIFWYTQFSMCRYPSWARRVPPARVHVQDPIGCHQRPGIWCGDGQMGRGGSLKLNGLRF